MTFIESLKRLGIEDYADRIFNSNSRGELIHLGDYIDMAEMIDGDASWFRPIFVACVEFSEQGWRHPEHCFQHMPRLMREMTEAILRNTDPNTPSPDASHPESSATEPLERPEG